MAKLFDRAALADLGRSSQVSQIRLSPGRAVAGPSLALETYDGKTAGQLSWLSIEVGTDLRKLAIPWLFMLSLSIAVSAAAVLHRAWLASRELEANETRERYLSNHDSLTKLPNRRAFEAHIRANSERALTMLFMDLDGFKEVNDRYGHARGDELLRLTAQRLARLLPREGFLARLGGDEFAMLISGEAAASTVERLIANILPAIREPFVFCGASTVIGVSIGVAESTDELDEDLMRRADIAMYAAKDRGRNTWQRYTADLDQARLDRQSLTDDLRYAIAACEIEVVYQPIVNARDGGVVGVEALARWQHPKFGLIAPDAFIPLAEESGLIIELGRNVLRTACLAARDWPCRLAVNLSPAQFTDPALVDGVLAILDECKFSPDALEFEITETYLLRRPDLAAAIIRRLRSLGIRVALDDFGAGYASIAYLRLFELDLVKLDRALTERVSEDPTAAEVVIAIVSLCKALKLPLLAEGVETSSQAKVLKAAGCAYLQGWYFGYPMTAADIDDLFSNSARAAG